jgi:nicotinamidase-related amidase
MTRALLIVDIQNDYFPGGANPLDQPEAAAANAARLLASFRAAGEQVVHIQHIWDEPDASFMKPGTRGVEIHESVAPIAGEPVVHKAYPNSFRETTLGDHLTAAAVDEIVVCGMMTAICVDATARASADAGYTVTVVHDACATMPLSFNSVDVPAAAVHASFLAALADSYGTVTSTDDFLR